MGPFMVEIVFCPVTRRGRKKRKGQNKNAITDSRNEGPAFRFIPQEDTLKVTLDLSEDGPVFSALDEMMMKMLDEDSEDRAKRSKETAAEAKTALKNLLKSGIPGIETMFAGPSADASGRKKTAGKLSGRQKGFHKMTEGSRTKFMKAVFGKEGTSIDTTTAAALLAATYSGGDPQIGENIAQLLVPEMGAKVDQNMMAALMSSSSMINAGATIEEVMRCMKDELSKSDLTEDEILHKTKTIMKAFGKEDKSSSMLDFSLVSKQSNSALKQAQISPKEFAKLVLCQRILAHCGVTAENLAKMMMVQSQLVRRGAQARHVAEVLVSVVGDGMSKAKQVSDFQNPCQDEKLKKNDVLNSVRITEALDNENEPSWKEVKQMKDILSGASTSSAESIGLNLQRALKAAQLSKMDIANTIQAQKAISALDPNSELVAKLMLIEKNIAQNGVPPVEIARVLGDGVRSREVFDLLAETALSAIDNDFKANDVELMVKVYEQLGLKGNIPTEVIEHIDRNLIQVRCSLEDVAENHVSSALSRGERETMIARSLTEVLMKTGASLEIVVSTMYTVLKRKMENIDDLEMIKIIGRSLIDAAVESDDFLPALKSLQVDNMELIEEDLMKRGMEILLKELQFFPDEIRQKIDVVYPPPPPVEKVQAEKDELDLLTADEIFARFAKSKGGPSDSLDSSRRGSFAGKGAKNPTISVEGEEPMDENMAKMLLQRQMSSSSSRRGSFMSTETTKRSSVAYVVDKTADQRLSGMVEDVTDGDEANGALNPASLKRLQALDPTNPANADLTATCNLAKEELSKGGFVNEAGVLCTESGQPIRGPSGSPVTMDVLAAAAQSNPLVTASVIQSLNKSNPSAARSLAQVIDANEESDEEATDFLSGMAEDTASDIDYEAMLAMMDTLDSKPKKKKKKGKSEDKLAMLSKMMKGGARGLKLPEPKTEEPKRMKRVGKVDKHPEILPTEEKKIEATKKWQAPKQGEAPDPEVVKARKALAKAAKETGSSAEELEQAAIAAGLTPDELVAMATNEDSEKMVNLLETIQTIQEEVAEEEAEEAKSSSEAMNLNKQHSEALLERMRDHDQNPEDFLASLDEDAAENDLQYQQMLEMMALLDEGGGGKKKKKGKSKLDMLSKMMQGGVRGAKGPPSSSGEGKRLKRVGKIDARKEHNGEEEHIIEATRKWQGGPGSTNDSEKESKEARKFLAQAAAKTGTDPKVLEEAAMASGLSPEQILALVQSDASGDEAGNVVRLLESLANCDEENGVDPILLSEAISEGMSLEDLAQLVGDIAHSSDQQGSSSSSWEGMGPGKLPAKSEVFQSEQTLRKGKGFHRSKDFSTETALKDLQKGHDVSQVLEKALESGASVEELGTILTKAQGQPISQEQFSSLQSVCQAIQDGHSIAGLSREIRKAQIQQLLQPSILTNSVNVANTSSSLPQQDKTPSRHAPSISSRLLQTNTQEPEAEGGSPNPHGFKQTNGTLGAQSNTSQRYPNTPSHPIQPGNHQSSESMSHFGAQGVSKSVMENLSKTASQLSPKALTEAAIAQGANADQVAQLLAQTNCSPQEAQALQAKAILAGLESSKLTPQGNMSPQKLQKLSQSTKTLPPEVAAQVALKEGASLEQALQLAQAQGASEAELTKIKTQIVNQGQVLADNLGSDGGNGLTQDDLDVIAAATNSMPLEMAMEEALSQGASIEQALQLAQANGASIKQLSQIRSKLSAQTGVAKSSAIMDSITAALESGTDPAQILETARANGASTSELSQIRAATILSQGGNLQDVIEEAKAQGATAEDLAKIVASVTSEDIGFPIQDKSHQGKVSGASVTQVAQNLTNAQGPQGPSIQDMILTAKSNGASPQQIAQMVAQSNGPEYKSPEDVALLAKVIGLNPKEASLMQASISISQGGDILSVIQKAKANGASAGEIAQLASMAAGQEGADVKAILQAAAAEGVPPSGLSQIKSIASVSQGANLRDVLKAAKAQGANQEYIAQITAAAAASQNLSASELLAMAKEVGMNDSDLDVIVQSVPPDLFQTQISKAVSALDQGANPDQILSAARDSGMPDCEILKLEAKLAITQGKSVLEVLSKAKANGASTVELKQIEAMVKSTTDPNQMMEAVTAGVLSTSELVAALRKSDHANQETLLKTAIQFGLSDTDLSQLATAAGVSRSELQQMKSLVNETTGLTPKQLAMVSADEKNSTPQQIAAAAMKSGANVNQALELAKAQGATKQELEEIRTQMSSLVAPSRAPINPGLSKETLAQLVKSNADTSEEELAKLVIALGATPDQISDLMASQGVSQQMLNQIQSNAQAAQKVTTQLNKGVTADKLSRIQRRLHGSSPADLVEMSLIQGASPAQILELGKAQGFNASQLKELQSVIQKTVQEIIDNGGNITVLGLGGQQSANAERGNKYEVKDYGYLFDTSLNMGSDVDLDTIRYRVAKHVAGTSNSGKGFVTSTNVTASIPIPNQEEPHFGGIGSYEGEKRPQLKPTVIEQDEIPRQRKTYNDSKSDIKVERDQRVDRSMDDVESRSGTRIRQSNQDSKTESKQESNVTKSPKVDQIQIAKESNGQVKVAKPKKETYNPTPQRRSEKDASPIKRARDQLQPFTSKRPPAEKPVASKARESRFQCEEEPSSTIQSRRKLTNYDDGLASIRYRTTEPIQSDAPSYKSSYIPTQYSGLDKSLAARKRSRFQPFNDGGILISKDGVTKFRTADDMNETMDDTAFQKALTEFNSRDQSEISAESQRLLSKMFQTQTDNIAAIRERLKVVQDQGMSSIHSRSYDLSSVVDYTAYGSGKSTYVPMQSSARDFSSPEPQVVQRGPRQRRIVPPTDSSDYRPKSWRDMIDLPEYRSTRNQTPYDIGVPRLPRTRTPTPVRTLSNGDPYSSKTNYTPTYVPRNYRNSSPGAAARSAATPGVASADMRPSRDALPKGYNKSEWTISVPRTVFYVYPFSDMSLVISIPVFEEYLP
ncbi:hypothetical protein TCAL_04722 [Tigriopus californicus]|uniref:Uncharacterized protein n=1 Tax=Tigriopus californicus TaxID=6832 RepID=A0A553PTE2_TIGCA|nr:hypothetical protein TCAL_04722 [Tigriopus californicus]